MQKGFAPAYFLIGILVILVAVGGIYYFNKSSTKPVTPQPQISVSPTPQQVTTATNSAGMADWKTYINTKLGFSFKYPPEASVTESKSGEIDLRYIDPGFSLSQALPGYWISFDVKDLNSKDLKAIIEEEIKSLENDGGASEPLSEIKVGNYSGYTYSRSGKVLASGRHIYLAYAAGDSFIRISYNLQYEDSRGYQKKIDQIISTFKFQ